VSHENHSFVIVSTDFYNIELMVSETEWGSEKVT